MLSTAEETSLRLPPRYLLALPGRGTGILPVMFMARMAMPRSSHKRSADVRVLGVCLRLFVFHGSPFWDMNIMVDDPLLRTAEEARLRLPPRYPLGRICKAPALESSPGNIPAMIIACFPLFERNRAARTGWYRAAPWSPEKRVCRRGS